MSNGARLESKIYYFLLHPAIVSIRLMQFFFAVIIFFYMAFSPLKGAPGAIPPAVLHIAGNVLLILSVWVAFYSRIRLLPILVLSLALSVCAELGQSFTDTRVTDSEDFIANAIGLTLGYLCCWLMEKFLARRSLS